MRKRYVEILGLPSAGKTTLAQNLAMRGTSQQELIREAAEVCPIVAKTSPAFNLWTAGWTLMQMAEAIPRTSTLIVDRGVVDALAWLVLHTERRNSADVDLRGLIDSVGTVMRSSLEPFLIYLTVPFEVAVMRREGEIGRIVNRDTWPAIQSAYLTVVNQLSGAVPLLALDTQDKNPAEVLRLVQAWLEP